MSKCLPSITPFGITSLFYKIAYFLMIKNYNCKCTLKKLKVETFTQI